jgi:hypothetical protein
MTPKEKAIELVEKFTDIENEYNEYSDFKQAKQCALIAVDEAIEFELRIVKEVEWLSIKAEMGFKCEGLFWEEVKQEIQKL